LPDGATWSASIEEYDRFDAPFFGISPREAVSMDPQQRLLLEVSWEALENAGISPASIYGSSTGVYFGICSNDYCQMSLVQNGVGDLDAHFGSGSAHSVAAGRVAYVLGLHGAALALDHAG